MEREGILENVASCCSRCGQCSFSCDIMAAISPRLPGDIAACVLGEEFDQRLSWFVPRCSLCGLCAQSCPNHIDIPTMILAARSLMLEKGFVDTSSYRAMEVDRRWNAISLFRRQYSIDFSDIERRSCEVAFLPGCTLINEASEVVRATHYWLEEALGQSVALVSDCCGMPLQEMGYDRRYEAYEDALWKKLSSMGVGKLIVACPNCLGRLAHRGSRAGIQTQLVYELMATMGLRAPLCAGESFVIHDSCPARGTKVGVWVRELMGDNVLLEAEHCLDDSRCCGSGGAVGMYDCVLSGLRAQRRMSELLETDATTVVAYCMSSCSTLSAAAPEASVRHVLEVVFGKAVDRKANQEKVMKMWEGDSKSCNDCLLQTSDMSLPEIQGS